MTALQVLRVMMQGETAGRGDLYKLDECPYTAGSRKAKLWSAGFAAGRVERIEGRRYPMGDGPLNSARGLE